MASPEEIKQAAEAQLESVIQGGASQYSIGSRTVTKISPKELIDAMKELAWMSQRNNGSGGVTLGRLSRARR